MQFRVCPICHKRYLDWGANLMGKKPASPTLVCPKCKTVYPDETFKEPALEPYREPRKSQVLLCGLWPFGIVGFAFIVLGMLLNKIWVVVAGGLVFSFWILLIAMSICLWNEVCANARKAYEASRERLCAKRTNDES